MFNHRTNQSHTRLPAEQIPSHQNEETSHPTLQKDNNFENNLTCINNLTIALTFLFTIGLLYHLITWIPPRLNKLQYYDLYTNTYAQLIEQRLPKILWIYTQNQRDSQPMEIDLYLNYFADFATKSKYQVRYVNSLNAYDYLSNQTIEQITNTMSKRTVDETVHSFLKLALLHEKGGIMIEPGTVLLSDNFKWLEYMFDKYSLTFQTNGCEPENSHFFIHRSNNNYRNLIIAAVPGSSFFKQVYDLLTEVVVSQQMKVFHDVQEKYRIEGLSWDKQRRVYNYDDSFSNFINHVYNKNMNASTGKCSIGMQQPTTNITLFIQNNDNSSPIQVLFIKYGLQRLIYNKSLTNVKAVQAIGGLNQQNYINTLINFALGKYDRQQIIDSLIHRVLVAPGNKETFMQDLPMRSIELCVIIMEGLTNQQLNYTSTLFNKQTYSNWKLIMPAQDLKNAPKFQDQRILVIQQKSTKVHNIEKAAAKYCPPKGYAVLLNYNQSFKNQNAFLNIANAVQQRDIVGAYIPLSINGNYSGIIQEYTIFYRITDGIVNPKLDQMKHMINHFRVFSVETFKTIPQFAMRDWNGKYHKDRLIFLMDFHDLSHVYFANKLDLFTIKKNAHLWNIPRRVNILNDQTLLNIRELQQVSLEQLKVTRTRVSSRNVKMILQDLRHYKIPFSKMAVFNPGDDFVPVEQKQGPQLIPKIIHQVWLGSKIPPAKQYFIQKTKKIYPNYELKIWREHNITKQIFPTTYDIIQNLLDFNKRSPYNKLATVTDIMRHEILYREGGLWKDAGMNMLRAIPESFLKYKLILPTDRLYQYRYLQGMCFFGNMPKFQNMLRINNYRNLNRMRIFSSDPFNIAGPVDFRQLVVGQEQFDPDFILLPYETFYPGQMGQHPQNDLCTTQKIGDKQKYEIVEKGWYLLPDCELKYPYAFAIQHNNYGSSWVGPKQLQFLS